MSSQISEYSTTRIDCFQITEINKIKKYESNWRTHGIVETNFFISVTVPRTDWRRDNAYSYVARTESQPQTSKLGL